jgi:Kef-type K+ transport system membrane component KefB
MSSVSLEKFAENLPVTGIVALSQAAVGFGVGLLLADKFGETARQRTAIALIGAGAATVLPLVAGIVSHVNNRPDSSRRMRQQLEGIRRSAGVNGLD